MTHLELADRAGGGGGVNVFVRLEQKIVERRKRGADVISLAIGSPDGPTPKPIVDAIVRGALDPQNAGYPPFAGKMAFREAIASWIKKRFAVEINPTTQVTPLPGTAEGPTMLSLAFLNVGDVALMQDPLFPLYHSAVRFAGGQSYALPIHPGNNYWLNLQAVPKDILQKAKILFLNYPHNPTGAVATLEQLREAVAFAQAHHLILCYDNAYSEITFDGFNAPSLLQVEGAEQIGIEFHSLSKTYNMAGWRVGFAIGNPGIIAGLSGVVTSVDTRIPGAIQDGAVAALSADRAYVRDIVAVYERRRQVAFDAFARIGWNSQHRLGTFYLWEPVPPGFTSETFALELLDETGVVVTPGIAFGDGGEGFVRIALVVPDEQLVAGIARIGDFLARHGIQLNKEIHK